MPDEEVVCECGKVTKRAIVDAVKNGASTLPLIKIITGAGRGRPCPNDHGCLVDVREIIARYGTTTISDSLRSMDEEAGPGR